MPCKAMLFVATVALVVVAQAWAFNALDCSEMAGCYNEYQWKHKSTVQQADAFCNDRYPTCVSKASGQAGKQAMRQFCDSALKTCSSVIWDFLERKDGSEARAQAFCNKRLPRCVSTTSKRQ